MVGGVECASNAGVVERIVYPAEFLDGLLDTVVDRLFVCDIEFNLFDRDVGVVFLELDDCLGNRVAIEQCK